MNGFSGLKSFRDFRETGPCSDMLLTRLSGFPLPLINSNLVPRVSLLCLHCRWRQRQRRQRRETLGTRLNQFNISFESTLLFWLIWFVVSPIGRAFVLAYDKFETQIKYMYCNQVQCKILCHRNQGVRFACSSNDPCTMSFETVFWPCHVAVEIWKGMIDFRQILIFFITIFILQWFYL